MSTPLVSICVPSIGRTLFLPAVRAAIEAQTIKDYEVLVLDNASGDEAQAFFAQWQADDERVRVLRTDERVPMFANFDRGAFAARGKYVTFFHDDDVYRPNFLEASVSVLEREPCAGFSGSNFNFVDEYGVPTGEQRWIASDEVWAGRRYIRTVLERGKNPIPMPGLMYRREVFDIHGFDVGVSMHWGDFSVLMRYAETWDVAMIAESLMAVRRHDGQASVSMDMQKALILRTHHMNEYLDGYLQRHPSESAFVEQMRRAVKSVEWRHMAMFKAFEWTKSISPKRAEAGLRAARNLRQRFGR